MAKFRKKPVVIEAVQLLWSTWNEMCDHADVGKLSDGKPEGCYVGPDGKPALLDEVTEKMGLMIPTLEGLMIGSEGDWIIKGVKGELYPCKPDIFEATYEPVEKADESNRSGVPVAQEAGCEPVTFPPAEAQVSGETV